ncbi:hypothetical protein SAMD00024442_2_28 [Candidatus Symbiothrix dinenymphae]|nr:hypothetical protein SAMD00024442_2_28 [Candidatus Symbiothrix dinenymphae]
MHHFLDIQIFFHTFAAQIKELRPTHIRDIKMKRVILLVSLCFSGMTLVVAQNQSNQNQSNQSQAGGCVEVRGVETKTAIYETNKNSGYDLYGFTFINNNSFIASLEVELWYSSANHSPRIIDTKNFDLVPGETYIWENEIYRTNLSDCYVKFKAYKCPR